MVFVLNLELRPAFEHGLRWRPWLRQRQTGARKRVGSGLYSEMGQMRQGWEEGTRRR